MVSRAGKADLSQAMDLWRSIFAQEWEERQVDIKGLVRLFSFFLSLRRLPLRLLWRLGTAAELWVVREGGEVVGVMGQLGERIPCLMGLVLAPKVRGRGVVRAFVQGVCTELARAGFPLARSMPAAGSPVVELGRRLGWTVVGRAESYALSFSGKLFEQARCLPYWAEPQGAVVRVLGQGEREALVRAAISRGEHRLALTLDGTYGIGHGSFLFGLRELFLVAERGGHGVGYVGMEFSRYQAAAALHVPFLPDEGVYPSLLARALDILSRFGKDTVYIDLWEDHGESAAFLKLLGARPQSGWTWIVREL